MKASISREVVKALGVWSGYYGHGPGEKKAKRFMPISSYLSLLAA